MPVWQQHQVSVPILMYHSVSDGPGPTCIPLPTFKAQMEALQRCNCQVISLADYVAWHQGSGDLPERAVVLTFDDGFADFYEAAFPVLHSRNWTATVFLPSELVGGIEIWDGQLEESPRQLMSWDQISELRGHGIEFGGHSQTHADLTALSSDELRRQICSSIETIREHLGDCANCYAPPYGRCNARVLNEIRKWCEASVGVQLQRANRQCDLYDLPRVEMHYFRNVGIWEAFLQRQAESYFLMRRSLRTLRRWF